MRKMIQIILLFSLVISAKAFDEPYGGIKLLDGYKFKRSHTIDTSNGIIYKEGGLTIEFESGTSEGYAIEPKNKNKYIWYREQTISNHKVRVALTKPDVGIVWKPEKPRSSNAGNILVVTFLEKFVQTNFYAEVLNEEEIADVLLMVLTYDPDK